jgi:hypothetical protein
MAIILDGTTGSSQPAVTLTGATSGSITLTPPAVAGTQGYTMPSALPTASGQALTATTAGVMSWAAAGGSPGGSNGQFQYNNSSAFGGASILTYNATGPIVATTLGVGAATPSNSGSGITFPSTNSPSSNANTLDDYEQGTYTPTDLSGAGLTFSSVIAYYIKIGKVVVVSVQLVFPSTANGNTAKISLPFTGIASYEGGGVVNYAYPIPGSSLTTRVAGGDTGFNIVFLSSSSGGTNANFTGLNLKCTVTYFAAS